jgi:hypothetical protein
MAIAKGQNVCLKDNLVDYVIDPVLFSDFTYCTDFLERDDIDLDNKITTIGNKTHF